MSASSSSYANFRFAANGVCLHPSLFIDSKTQQRFTLRDVPGNGDCMFLAVALATTCSMGLDVLHTPTNMNRSTNMENPASSSLLQSYQSILARQIREVVASVFEASLQARHNQSIASTLNQNNNATKNQNNNSNHPMCEEDYNNTLIVTQQQQQVATIALLQQATKECGYDSEWEYLRQLRLIGCEGGLYGGGPELTVLTNLLRRPICIYEIVPSETNVTNSYRQLDNAETTQWIQCQGIFGATVLDDPLPEQSVINQALSTIGSPGCYSGYNWNLHILVVNTTSVHEKHACVLLPCNN